jgi:hypothetical protein
MQLNNQADKITTPSAVTLQNEAETKRLAEDIAMALLPGDLVFFQGDLGAGKTTLIRYILQSLANDNTLQVPSPTYTLVQHYDLTRFPVLHTDLYRLEDAGEVTELGLDESLSQSVVLVEWPEKGKRHLPKPCLTLQLEIKGDERLIYLKPEGRFAERLNRSSAIRHFLNQADWAESNRFYMQGDASSRTYERILKEDQSAILMNAPAKPDGPPIRNGLAYSKIAHLAEDIRAFVAIGEALRKRGFSAPEIYAFDLKEGFLLAEDLGKTGIVENGLPNAQRYKAAAKLLAKLHQTEWQEEVSLPDWSIYHLPSYDIDAFLIEAELLLDWFLPFKKKSISQTDKETFKTLWEEAIKHLLTHEESLVLRDYHSPNCLWLPDRKDHRQIGIIDYQDAVLGPAAYDLASLGQDARITIPDNLEEQLIDQYYEERKAEDPTFDKAALIEAAVFIIKFRFCNRIIDVNSWERKIAFFLQLIKPHNACCCFFRNTFDGSFYF